MNLYAISRRILLVIPLIGLLSLIHDIALTSDISDTHENRIAAAERYLKVVSIKDMMASTIEETAKTVPNEYRSIYIKLMMKSFNIGTLERAAKASMVHHFTVSQLNALATFYGSPEGRSVMKKFGVYISDLMPVLQQEMLKTQESIRPELETATNK